MNKVNSFLAFFMLTILSVSGGIGVASIDSSSFLSNFENRLSNLAYVSKVEVQKPQGQVAGVFVSEPQIIPKEAEYAMLVSIAKAATKPICTSLLSDMESGVAPLDVKFTGSGQGDSLSYKFVFGDGEQVTTLDAQTIHTYINPGVYSASLQVISSKLESDNTDSCKTEITVTKETKVVTPAPAVTEATHLVCRNFACVRVAGEGQSECSANADCAAPKPVVENNTKPEPEAKPLVPVTGNSQLAIYLVIALGFISAGLILLIFL